VTAVLGQQGGGRELQGGRQRPTARCACSAIAQGIPLQAGARRAEGAGRAGGGRGCRGEDEQPSPAPWGEMWISDVRWESAHQPELGLDQPPETAGVCRHKGSAEQFHRATDCVVERINSRQRIL